MEDVERTQSVAREAQRILGDLVAFPTVSRDSNLKLIQYVESLFEAFAVQSTRIYNAEGNKANLCASVGPRVEGGIILSGHTDVVPVVDQPWDTDPFTLISSFGKLYGRGSADMKGFIAVCLALLPECLRYPLKKPITFAFSYDEEIGCLGAPTLVKHIASTLPKPALAIIGEPTMMHVVTAHKGVFSYQTTVTGLEAHSSAPALGVNAVQIAAKLVSFLAELGDTVAREGMRDERFTPSYSTVHVGIIEGGTARNIIPKQCNFVWEIRPLPGDNADAIYARFDMYTQVLRHELKKRSELADIINRPMSRMEGFSQDENADAVKHAMACAKTNATQAVAYGTEAGIFSDADFPVIVCGPGDIAQAHKANEFVEIAQLEQCAAFLLAMLERLRA